MLSNLKFALIVPTLNRVQEVERLFQSLDIQDYKNFEVIVVDQNADDRLVKFVALYHQRFPILHLRESKCGLSHARNIGLPKVLGDIVAFPDDDCLYPNGLLTRVARFFNNNLQWDGVIGRVYDLEGDQNAFEPCGDDRSQEVDYAKGYKDSVSCAMFFRAPVTEKIRFNERLGAGAGTPWECGEETDYLFQCLDAGYRFYYDATLIVRHPNPYKKKNFRQRVQREYAYGLGKGYFLATHHKLPDSLIKVERRAPYSDSLSELPKANLRRAFYFLVNGISTSLGYRAGRKKD